MADNRSTDAWKSLPPEEQVNYLVRQLAETEAALAELTGGVDLVVDPTTATTVLLREAQAQLQAAHDDLEMRVAERTAELSRSAAELTNTAAELRTANETLQAEITERRQVQEQLEHERAILKAVIDNAPVAVVVTDAQARVTLTNPLAGQLYVRPIPFGKEHSSHAALQLCYPDGTPYATDDLPLTRSALQGETHMAVNVMIEWPDGEQRDLLVNSCPIRDGQGIITGAVGVFQDVTDDRTEERERERLLIQVQQQAKELGAHAAALREARDQLEHRVQERTADLVRSNGFLRVLHGVDQAILAAQTPAEIAQVVVERIQRIEPGWRVSVLLFDLEAGKARRVAVSGFQPDEIGLEGGFPFDSWRLAPQMLKEQFAAVEDLEALSDPDLREQAMLALGSRSYFSMPMVAQGEVLGAISVWQPAPGRLAPELEQLLRQVADSLAVGMQNARLFEQVSLREASLREAAEALENSRVELRALTRRLVEAQEEERKKIARELHDSSSQSLTSLTISLGMLARASDCPETIRAGLRALIQTTQVLMEELHQLSASLRPASLDRAGLVAALQQYAEGFQQQTGIETEVVSVGLEDRRVPAEVETAIYRIVQEALTNALRHAQANHIGIIVKYCALPDAGCLVSTIVEDDGVGFDLDEARRLGRLGLVGMQERVEMLGGRLTIESAPGAGTTIYVEVPGNS